MGSLELCTCCISSDKPGENRCFRCDVTMTPWRPDLAFLWITWRNVLELPDYVSLISLYIKITENRKINYRVNRFVFENRIF